MGSFFILGGKDDQMKNLNLLTLLGVIFLLTACGSGGGGGDAFDSESNTSSSMGTAAVFIKDAPTDEYDSIFLCINEVTLEPGSVTIFESDECVEIDLLDHREKPFLLNIKDVPARTYTQIRMSVDFIRTEGGSCDKLDVKLPSGVVKINPQGGIPIKSGDKAAIEIDVHARKSINIHVAGKSGKCIFRPVVFATVTSLDQIPPKSKCPRILNGTITAIRKVEGDVKGFQLRLRHYRQSEITIKVDDNTIVFDEDGSFTTPDALEVGQKVKVRGEIQRDAVILSSVVTIGGLIELHGTAISGVERVNGDLKFEIELGPGQEIVDEFINVVVDNQTLILIDCRTEVSMDAIKSGTGVRAIGKLSEGDLIAVALFLEEQEDFGTIVSMQSINTGYNMEFIPSNENQSVIIFLPDSADAVLECDGDIEKNLLAELVNCEPRKARLTLNESDPDIADVVEVQDEVIGGKIKTTNLALRRIVLFDETIIQVQDKSTILKNGSELITFVQLKDGDEITVFGLAACPCDDVNFYGFVIVVLDNVDGNDS
jgi:hypothetical protein